MVGGRAGYASLAVVGPICGYTPAPHPGSRAIASLSTDVATWAHTSPIPLIEFKFNFHENPTSARPGRVHPDRRAEIAARRDDDGNGLTGQYMGELVMQAPSVRWERNL